MAAPKGQYTPSRGPLAGTSFRSYFSYQQARAISQGFTNYSAERRAISDPMFRALESRMRSVSGQSGARSAVRQFMATQPKSGSGSRKHNAIKWGMDQGLWDSGDDAADDIPY